MLAPLTVKLDRDSKKFLDDLAANRRSRDKDISMALARAVLGTICPKSEHLDETTENLPVAIVRETDVWISAISDYVPLDYTQVHDDLTSFWRQSVHAATPSALPLPVDNDNVLQLFHINDSFTPEQIETIRESKDLLLNVQRFKKILGVIATTVEENAPAQILEQDGGE